QEGSHVGLAVEGKGGKTEKIKIQPKTHAAIFEYCNQHDSDTVFLNQYGKQMSTQAVWRIVEKYVARAGIKKKITPHSLRHTFVTLAIDGGAKLHKVQTAARHADPKTTMRYYRNRDNMEDNAVDYIELSLPFSKIPGKSLTINI
ncbi:MAG: tyrosine-type recombinase/integrase, partial [Bacillus sp. (in: Bacteria)]|nr:tyrosine-type recombinase/integrase [Bacillus sp. (in: firmicutes)]